MRTEGRICTGDELYKKQIAELAGGPLRGPAAGMVPRASLSSRSRLSGLVPPALFRWLRRVSPAFQVRL